MRLYQNGIETEKSVIGASLVGMMQFTQTSKKKEPLMLSVEELQLITLASHRSYMCDPVEAKPRLLPLHWRPKGYDTSQPTT